MIKLFRIQPQGPPQAYKSFSISMPLTSHWIPVTCEDYECEGYLFGWTTTVDETTSLGQKQAHYIRHDRTRKHSEEREPGGLTVFTFEAGQRCFGKHQVQNRPSRYYVRDGDWRQYGRARQHTQGKFWVEDLQETLARVAEAQQKG